MKIFRKLFLALFTMSGAIALVACGGDTTVKVDDVDYNGLNTIYYTEDTIDFDSIELTLSYSNKDSETLTRFQLDLEDVEDANDDTQFIIYTNGLAEQEGGNLLPGDYDIEYYIIGQSTEKEKLLTITVDDAQNSFFRLESFDIPTFVSSFKDRNIENETQTSKEKEAAFYRGKDAVYQVGDDNEFIFRPDYILKRDNVDAVVNLKTVARVYLGTGEDKVLLENDQYYTYNPESFGFDFTEDAIGETFTIEVIPQYYTKLANGSNIGPASFSFQVQDGWNVNKALDLGFLNVNNFTTTEAEANEMYEESLRYEMYGGHYARYRNDGNRIFYGIDADQNMQTAGYYAKSNNKIWREFLKTKGYTDADFYSIGTGINGLFIHGNINVTTDDLPKDFFILDNTGETTSDTSDAIGSLRDFAMLYQHLTNNEFNFNGNFFTINFEQIPVVESKHTGSVADGTSRLELFNNDNPAYFPAHATAFVFSGLKNGESASDLVTIKNLHTFGNAGNDLSAENIAAAGSLILLKSIMTNVKVENNLSRKFMISWFTETESTLDLNYVKTYDDINSAIFAWGSEGKHEFDDFGGMHVENSEFKHFGGPVALLVSTANKTNYVGGYYSSVTFDDATTVFDNPIAGNEAWFALFPQAKSSVSNLMNLDYVYRNYGATIKDSNEKVNLIALTMNENYLTADAAVKYSYSDVTFLNTNVGEEQIDVTFKGYGQNSPAACDPNQWLMQENPDDITYYPSPADFGTLGPAIIETSAQVNEANLSTFYIQSSSTDVTLYDCNLDNYRALVKLKQKMSADFPEARSTTNKLTGTYTQISTHTSNIPMGIILKLSSYTPPTQTP